MSSRTESEVVLIFAEFGLATPEQRLRYQSPAWFEQDPITPACAFFIQIVASTRPAKEDSRNA